MQFRMTGPGGAHLGQVRFQVRIAHLAAAADTLARSDPAIEDTAAQAAAMAIGRPRSSSVLENSAGQAGPKRVPVWPSGVESWRYQPSRC